MKYHTIWKFLAVLLCACSLLGVIAGGLKVVFLSSSGLYSQTPAEELEQREQNYLQMEAEWILRKYAAQTLGNCPEALFDQIEAHNRWVGWDFYLLSDQWYYTIYDQNGKMLDSTLPSAGAAPGWKVFDHTTLVSYPTIIRELSSGEDWADEGWREADPPAGPTTQPTVSPEADATAPLPRPWRDMSIPRPTACTTSWRASTNPTMWATKRARYTASGS